VCGPKIGSREGASLIAKHIPHGLWRPPEGKQSQDVEADELYDLFECIKPSDRRPAPFWVPELNRRSIEPLVTIALGSAQRRSKKDLDALSPGRNVSPSQHLPFRSLIMRRITVLVASALIIASTNAGPAAESNLNKDVNAARAASATVHSKPANAADKDEACRVYLASFYQSAMLRQAAAGGVDGARVITALDSVINIFNDLLAPKCGG
jgi:hypothetical protein